jgi:hypothetical protein
MNVDYDDPVVVMTQLQVLDQDFFVKGFGALFSCWDRCLIRVVVYRKIISASSCFAGVINATVSLYNLL